MHGHAHHNHERKVEDLEERENVVIVYQTLDADFDGPVGGYRTGDPGTTEAETATHKNVGVGPAVGATATATKEKTTEAKATDEATTTSKEEAATTKETEALTTQTSAQSTETTKAETTEKTAKQASTTESQSTATSFVTSASPTAETSQDVNDLLAATSTGSATDSAASASSTAIGSSTTSAGMSGGAKAGVAIGVILGVGVIAALIFFIVRKKKRSKDGYQQENEKAFGGEGLPEGGLAASLPPPKPQTPSTPPVLNVRPVTQFAPDLSGGGGINPATAGAAGAAAGSAAIASRNLTGDSPPPTPPKSAGSSPNPFNDPVNPFGTADTPVSAHAPSVSESSNGPSGSTMAAAAVGTAAAGAVAGAAAASHESKEEIARPGTAGSRAHSPPVSPQSSTSPVNGAFSAAAAGPTVELAGAAAGAAGPNNVHRVQLDFNPSMEDELGLRSGSLVRLLHEYDDGWALCIRLDRSQQGVAPRSCLSARPVMPRPRPPPGTPGSRGPPIMGPDGRPMAPPGRFYPQDARPISPSGPGFAGPPGSYPGTQMSPVQFPAVPRSMSPGPGRPGPRAMSPGPGGMPVPRSMSPGPGGMPGPRSMSPGPGRPSPRSMSPGPYGHPGMQRPQMPVNQRQRSNSAGNMAPPNIAAAAPPVSSPLAAPVPAPTGELPAIPSSAPTSPSGSQVSRKPVPAQDA